VNATSVAETVFLCLRGKFVGRRASLRVVALSVAYYVRHSDSPMATDLAERNPTAVEQANETGATR